VQSLSHLVKERLKTVKDWLKKVKMHFLFLLLNQQIAKDSLIILIVERGK